MEDTNGLDFICDKRSLGTIWGCRFWQTLSTYRFYILIIEANYFYVLMNIFINSGHKLSLASGRLVTIIDALGKQSPVSS